MQTIYGDLSIPRILATKALCKLWKGAYLSAISPVRFSEQSGPPLPGPNYVRVVNHIALICGTDLHMVRVDVDPGIAPAALPSTDRLYLGHEICGEVSEVGSEVTRVRPGDRVTMLYMFHSCYTQGIDPLCRNCAQGEWRFCLNQAEFEQSACIGAGWGDQCVVHEHQLYVPPEELSDDEVALIEPTACGIHIVLRSMPDPGDQIMVLGCGTMGLMVIRALHALAPDARITALARYDFQGEAARRLGAHDVRVGEDGYEVGAAVTSAKLYRGQMGSAVLMGGFDVVYDCVGNKKTLTDALRWARALGRVVMVGNEFRMLKVDLTPMWFKEVRLSAPAAHGTEDWQGKRTATFEIAAQLFQRGKVTADGIITHRFPLSKWQEAIRTATDKRRYQSIKVAFVFNEAG